MTAAAQPSDWLASSLRGARILIVDDDRMQCKHLAGTVEGWEAIAFTAQTLSEALRLYRECNPDLVMCDVMMPLVDGYKLSQMFKREGKFVPIILLTALEDLESKRRGLAAGADEFLTKPVSDLELQIRVSSMLRIKRLADQLAGANEQLLALATLDALTQLPNRRVLSERLAFEFARATRYRHPLGCLMIDVDFFKKVNDTYGHPAGDKVLVEVAAALKATVRATDMAGRYGGEEFMVILPETREVDGRLVAERIRRAIALRTRETEGIPGVTASIGLATFDEVPGPSTDELLQRADQALYKAKQTGRDRVVCWSARKEADDGKAKDGK